MNSSQADHWQRAIQQQKNRLSGKKYSDVLPQLEYGSYQLLIRAEQDRYKNRSIPSHIQRIAPSLAKLDQYVQSINTIVQGAGSIACFVWGSVHAVFTVASSYVGIIDTVADMIEDLAMSMIQLAGYTALFPQEKSLDTCLGALINEYVGFCITAIIFFRRLPIWSLLKLFWAALDRDFRKHKTDIDRHLRHFKEQRRLLVDQELILTGRKTQSSLPQGQSTTSQPLKLYIVPFQQNPRFSGREQLLKDLKDLLTWTGGLQSTVICQRSCLLHGGGGVGKTQLAIEYTHRYRHLYDVIVWVNAETDSEIATGLATLEHKLHGTSSRSAGNRAATEAARDWLESTGKRWLLVFDNASSWSALQSSWPKCPSGSLIVTSQNAEIGQVTTSSISISPMDDSDGAELFLGQLGITKASPADRDMATQVSRKFGGLPLAIAHSAGYMRQTKAPLDKFLSLLEDRQTSIDILEESIGIFQYPKSLKAANDMALDGLGDNALLLIRVLSMLSADGVPQELLWGDHARLALGFTQFSGETSFLGALRELTARTLVDVHQIDGASYLAIHRSLQMVLLQQLDRHQDQLQEVFQSVVALVRGVYPRQSTVQFPQNNIWQTCERYSVHAMSILGVEKNAIKPLKLSMDYALLLSDVSNYYWERNIFDDALRASDAAEETCKYFLGEQYAPRADIHTIAGAVRDCHGISQRSKTLYHYEMAIALRQQWLNATDPESVTSDDIWNYANAWGNMTPVLLDYECYEDVILYADLAMTIKRKVLGQGSKSVIACYEQNRNKHVSLAALQRHSEAMKFEPDPENCMQDSTYAVVMIRFYFFWANIAMASGQLEVAHGTLLMVLHLRIKVFGPSGRSTLDTYYMLAVLEEKRGNLDAAVLHLTSALRRPHDWSLEALARAKYRLACLLKHRNQTARAQQLMDEATATRLDLWDKYAHYWPADTPIPDEAAMFDHIVPAESGRPDMRKCLPAGSMTPNLNAFCRELQGRLQDDGNVLEPKEISRILRTEHLPPVSNKSDPQL